MEGISSAQCTADRFKVRDARAQRAFFSIAGYLGHTMVELVDSDRQCPQRDITARAGAAQVAMAPEETQSHIVKPHK